jgi:hypothetical protein
MKKRPTKGTPAAKRRRKSLAGLMPLEPRVMYDAAGAHTAASHMVLDPHHNDPGHVTSTTNSSQAGAPTHAADAGLVKPVSPPPAPAFLPPTPNQSGDGIFFSGVTNTAVGANNPVVIDSGNGLLTLTTVTRRRSIWCTSATRATRPMAAPIRRAR